MLNKMFAEFNSMYSFSPKPVTPLFVQSSARLITDEVKELLEEVYEDVEITITVGNPKQHPVALEKVFAEFTDIVYITSQRATECGIVIEEALEEKHRSNMSKMLPMDMSRTLIASEMTQALKRYPHAVLYPTEMGYLIKCTETGKLVKPTCYSSEVFTEGVHFTKK